jgi:hypothetical protein
MEHFSASLEVSTQTFSRYFRTPAYEYIAYIIGYIYDSVTEQIKANDSDIAQNYKKC